MRGAAARLRAAGIEDAAFEVRLMMDAASGLSRADLIARAGAAVPPEAQARFAAMLDRRVGREPLQHILGRAGFFGLDLAIDRRALIPRPDSECVVEAALRLARGRNVRHVADLGTGSGCLLGALLTHLPEAEGTGVEADPAAASLAAENLAALGLAGRARVFGGRWADWTGWEAADLVISNPPYIRSAEIESLEPEVREFDPWAALDGGADGLVAYREIIALAGYRLGAGVPLVLEIGHDQREQVLELLQVAGFTDPGHAGDLGRRDRCVWAEAPGRSA
jgi:release factor glutamine methyltransferase